jgi:DNA ligase (NAD+)
VLEGGPQLTSHSESLAYLHKLGLPVCPELHSFDDADFEQLVAYTEEFGVRRHELPYETDGLVVKVDSLALQSQLGFTG